MILRLAQVFRYVLAHSSDSFTSLEEEIEFLHTYLQIEEARFGERFKVRIEIAPDVAGQLIPSLMLQPLVENALKHGLAPKLGPGCLWISAKREGDCVLLNVEDDGVGLRPGLPETAYAPAAENGKATAVGLSNIARRLATVYQERARITIEPRAAGGTRVSLVIPRENGAGR
jgi:two-component system LytT family sensor kinase